MKVTTTSQGLQSLQFTDQAGNRGIAEQSPDVDPANPSGDEGTSYLLLGRQDAPLQLNIDQVGELVEYLQAWLAEGRFMEFAPPSTKHSLPAPHRKTGTVPRC